MFDFISGLLSDTNADDSSVTVETAGVGFAIFIPKNDFDSLPELNSNVKLFTLLVHKEDSMTLYGFLNKDSKNLFKTLTAISGLGPKMALQILSAYSPDELISLIVSENIKSLTSIKGVGDKLAKKLIIELKCKFKNFKLNTTNVKVNETPQSTEASAVLESFGYSTEEIQNAIAHALSCVNEKASAEEILQNALRFLSQ